MELGIDLGAFLADVEQTLHLALADETGPVSATDTLMGAARHLCLGGGGKRARPMMVRLFGEACSAPGEHLVPVAVGAELIHSASLLHDDVVDAGMFRRGRPTVNARWGNIVA
ncbi:MAG TPA: polyprenyl synthetase family protein, partial [Myxococcaceae bacterium]|nr:polyprenyl synthetase family protein [Myxococcaceae bacterium]